MANISSPISSTLPDLIIGGGLAGLTAATYLARAGRSVKIVDRAPHLGGRAISQQVNGFKFNLGPRALYADGPARHIFDELGVTYSGHRPPLRGGLVTHGGRIDLLPSGLGSLMRAGWLGWRAKAEVAGMFARLPKLDASAWKGRSAQDWLDGSLATADARQLFGMLLRLSTYSSDLGSLDGGAAIGQLQLGLRGVLYLDGGWQTLVEGLQHAATRAGAQFAGRQRVTSVTPDGSAGSGRSGVRVEMADGSVHQARSVMLATGPQMAHRLTCEASSTLRRAAQNSVPIYAACLDVALEHLPQPRRRFALGVDRPTYYSVHSAVAELGPTGKALIHTLKSLAPDEVADRQTIAAELEAELDLLQPGWRDVLIERRFLPHMLVTHGHPGVGKVRPSTRVPDLSGVYVAGDWVGEHLLADAAVASGQMAARAILESVERQQAA